MLFFKKIFGNLTTLVSITVSVPDETSDQLTRFISEHINSLPIWAFNCKQFCFKVSDRVYDFVLKEDLTWFNVTGVIAVRLEPKIKNDQERSAIIQALLDDSNWREIENN